jgi:PAS domain-containing protein
LVDILPDGVYIIDLNGCIADTNPQAVPDGENAGRVMVARDVTERRNAEEELRRLARRITEAQEMEQLRVSRELHEEHPQRRRTPEQRSS